MATTCPAAPPWEIIAATAVAGGPDAPGLEVRLADGGTTTVEAGQYLARDRGGAADSANRRVRRAGC